MFVEEVQSTQQLLDNVDHFALTEHFLSGYLINQAASLHEFLNHVVILPVLENFEDPDNVRMDCLRQNGQFILDQIGAGTSTVSLFLQLFHREDLMLALRSL